MKKAIIPILCCLFLVGCHTHNWEKIEETYAPPSNHEVKIRVGFGSTKTLEKMIEKNLFGVTTIIWQCKICKELRKEEMLGK